MGTIGQQIRKRREEADLTLPELADCSGVAKGYLWQLENERASRPSAQTLFKIATALGTTVADLLGSDTAFSLSQELPESLLDLAREENLTEQDMQVLGAVHYRGERPKTKEDWRFLLESIRRAVRKRTSQVFKNARHRRTWNSLEALALTKVTGIEDPIPAMKALAVAVIDQAELEGPPTDLALVASIRGIVSIERATMKEAGRLIPSSRGLLVQVNEDDTRRRQNFTVAHEIAHTLMPTYSQRPVARIDRSVAAYSRVDEEEYLCDVGASALLFPQRWLRPRAVHYGPTIDGIIQLADEFHGSLQATALAWSQLGLWPYAVIFWEETLKPTELRLLPQPSVAVVEDDHEIKPRFRVAMTCRSPGFPVFIPRYKSVADDSVLREAAEAESASGILAVELDSRTMEFQCEAVYAPYMRQGLEVRRVMALLKPIDGVASAKGRQP